MAFYKETYTGANKMAKWDSYKRGLIRRQLDKELREIADKEMRKKKGLDDPPLVEFKKNVHWALYAVTELSEILMSRIDGIVKGTYLALDGQLNTNFERFNKEIKNLGMVVKRSNAETNSEMMKKLKQSSMRENKILSEIKEVQGGVDGLLRTMREDILKASKGIIKATAREITNLRGNLEVETDEVGDRVEKVEENVLNFLNTMDSDFNVTMKEKMSDIAKAIQVFNNELNKRSLNQAKGDEERFKQVDSKLEDLILKSHVATRTLTDNVTKNLGELKSGLSMEMNTFKKDSTSILVHNEEIVTSESKKTIEHVKELTDIVQENYVDTRGMLKDQHKQLVEALATNQKESMRIMEREIGEVRSLIANIRGDIELIKTFLTKLHA